MRIDLFNSAATEITGDVASQPGKPGNAPGVNGDTTGDRTTLSTGSSAVSPLVSQAMNTPEVRQELVQNLQQSIASGQYQLDPDQIAGAMIDEHA